MSDHEREDDLRAEVLRLRESRHDHSSRLIGLEMAHKQMADDLAETAAVVKNLARAADRAAALAEQRHEDRSFVLGLPLRILVFLLTAATLLNVLFNLADRGIA